MLFFATGEVAIMPPGDALYVCISRASSQDCRPFFRFVGAQRSPISPVGTHGTRPLPDTRSAVVWSISATERDTRPSHPPGDSLCLHHIQVCPPNGVVRPRVDHGFGKDAIARQVAVSSDTACEIESMSCVRRSRKSRGWADARPGTRRTIQALSVRDASGSRARFGAVYRSPFPVCRLASTRGGRRYCLCGQSSRGPIRTKCSFAARWMPVLHGTLLLSNKGTAVWASATSAMMPSSSTPGASHRERGHVDTLAFCFVRPTSEGVGVIQF